MRALVHREADRRLSGVRSPRGESWALCARVACVRVRVRVRARAMPCATWRASMHGCGGRGILGVHWRCR